MSISVSITSKLGSEKSLWAWSVSVKNNKFGSTKSKSETVGALVAIHSALSFIPEHLDIIFRTHDRRLVEVLSDPTKKTKNPLVAKLFTMIRSRKGFVRTIYVSPSAMNEEDKRALKILHTLSGGNKAPVAKGTARKPANSLLRPGSTTIKATATRRPKKVAQKLTTGLEDDWENDVDTSHLYEKKAKPVLCDSCDAPISPLTNECLCSA